MLLKTVMLYVDGDDVQSRAAIHRKCQSNVLRVVEEVKGDKSLYILGSEEENIA